MKKFLLSSTKWLRWVLVPAVVATLLLATTSPAFAQGSDPVADLTRGIDTAWVLIAGILVFWMQAGFALVEAGLTRESDGLCVCKSCILGSWLCSYVRHICSRFHRHRWFLYKWR